MKSVFKLLCMLAAVLALAAITVFPHTALPPAEVHPIVLVCILLAVGYAAASAAFTKHHTAAAGA